MNISRPIWNAHYDNEKHQLQFFIQILAIMQYVQMDVGSWAEWTASGLGLIAHIKVKAAVWCITHLSVL